MTLVLLDTNAYLRLARRIRPLLGTPFGRKGYVLTILEKVEDEVHRSPRLRFLYPWFDITEFSQERLATRIRLSNDEKRRVGAAASVFLATVRSDAAAYTSQGRSPPSPTDCYILAFGQIRLGIVATDDLGIHHLAAEFDLPVWHGHQLLKKMHSAKVIDSGLVRAIYESLENNRDLPASWLHVKHTAFKKIFGGTGVP